MAVLDERERQRLSSAIRWSRKRLRSFYENRYTRMQQIVGHHYGESPTKDKVLIPLLGMAVNIYARKLVSNAPRALITTHYKDLRPSSVELQTVMNHLLAHEMRTVETLQNIVFDSLTLLGIAKVGTAVGQSSEKSQGFMHDPGQVFFDHVLPDDFIVDMTAKRWEQIDYCGDYYWVPEETVMEDSDLDQKALAKMMERLKSSSDTDVVEDEYRSQRLTSDQDSPGADKEFVEHVQLCDLWLPKHKLMVTLAADDPTLPPLRVREWEGPERGPYHVLMYRPIPGNLMPQEPVGLWEGLHTVVNKLFDKLVTQAYSQKNLTAVAQGAEEDAKAIRDASDGDIIPVNQPESVKPFPVGGFDQANFGLTIQLKQLFSWVAGNMDALGGLGSQTDTVGQDRLLSANASEQVKDMQDCTYRFMQEVMQSMAHYLWTDPVSQYNVPREIEGTNQVLSMQWPFDEEDQDLREGDFFQYNFTIEPYSLQGKSPQERVQEVTNIFTQVIVPLAPMMQQMGQAINVEAFIKFYAKYANLPELKEMVLFLEGELMPEGKPHQGSSQKMQMPQQTHRTYERVSRAAGATHGAEAAIISQAMLGGNPQPAERMSVGMGAGA